MSTPPQPPSKKDRREAARAARVEAEQAAAASDQRKKRLAIVLGGIAAVVVIAIVLIAVAGGGDDGPKTTTAGKVADGIPEMTSMLAGVPQAGITLGNKKAKVTVVEFIDAQCPICEQFANNVFPTLVQDYVRTGKVLYQTRTLDFLDNNCGSGDDSKRGALFLNSAGLQNKFYNAEALLYSNHGTECTGWLTTKYLTSVGRSIPGFNTPKALADMNTPAVQASIGAANALFSRYGGTGTPTLLVGPTGGTLAKINASSVTDPGEYKTGIDAALKSNQ